MFSDDFVNRLGEAGGTPSRQELDIGAVNGNSQYWVDITEAYNNDREHYNGFALGEPRSQYVSVDPALAVSHARSKLIGLWERVVWRYDSALTKAKRTGFNAACWEYCDGHVDALYMDDWLQIREDHQGNIVGLLPQNSHTSTLSNDKEVPTARPPVDASDEAPTKRRRLGAVDRILEYIQEDEETGIAERQRVREERDRRQREREESRKGESCAVLDRLSVSVRGAMATLQVLKEGRANQEQIDAAERALNKLISSWTQAMTNAANEQQ